MFNFFGKKKEQKLYKVKVKNTNKDIRFYPIYNNDAINIVHDACTICVAGEKERNTLKERASFISGKIKLGHESILEHSNYIMMVEYRAGEDGEKDFAEISNCFKYLNVLTKSDEDEFVILIGGSARGFKHVIRTIENPNNSLYCTIIEYIKAYIPSCFFADLIEDDIFAPNDFFDLYLDGDDITSGEDDGYIYYPCKDYRKNIDWNSSYAKILNLDDIRHVFMRKCALYFTYYELMDFVTVNTIFVNVSRSCSHQIVRHRNGITQLSQRYVNMENAINYLPTSLKELDNWDEIEPVVNHTIDTAFSAYGDMIKAGVKREDARYILPNSCATTLYMTFTFRNLIKACELRMDKHAQLEIRELFTDLKEQLEDEAHIDELDENITFFDYVLPRYKFEEVLCANDKYDLDIDFKNVKE